LAKTLRPFLKSAACALLWAVCILFLPVALFRVYFHPYYMVFALLFFAALRHGLPRLLKKHRTPSIQSALFATEVFLFVLGLVYYMSDTRARECGFPPNQRLAPLAAYAQCRQSGNAQRAACLDIATNPYGLAVYKDALLTVSGLDHTTLGHIPLNHGPVRAVSVSDGNAQQIAVDQERGLAVLPLWRKPDILLYDLGRQRVARHFPTRGAQLVGAEKSGNIVYVVGEGLGLYSLDLASERLTRHPLRLRTHRLYDIQVDPGRAQVYLSDWMYGVVYKLNRDGMHPERYRMLWGMAGAMALDAPRCELYVSRLLYGRVDVLDCRSLRTVRTLRAGRGAHELALSPDSDSLYVVNYFEGTFLEINRRTGRLIDSFCVGRQTRALHLDPATGRLFLASKCGIYEVKR
jgi:hypothetical protein